MAILRLDELDHEGKILNDLPGDHAAALSETGLVDVRPEGRDIWRVSPNGKVGAVLVGDHQVQVLPKAQVKLSNVLFLLGYAIDPRFRPDSVIGTEQPDLWPALAESLALLAERATNRGVLQGYHKVDASLRTVRGRIRIGDQVSRRPGMIVPVEVSYTEFTLDIPENQILRAAVRRMLAVPGLSDAARARLAHQDVRLAGASRLVPGNRLPSWQHTRRNEPYQPALQLAELILAHTSAEADARDGTVPVVSFVVDMAKVFEDFVGRALGQALARASTSQPGRTRMQYTTYLDVDRGISIRPDVVHSVADRPRLVFDAKYKATNASGTYPSADQYQMLAYCTALNLSVGWLVYAGGADKPRTRTVRHSGIEIVEFPLDLGRSPQELLRQIDELASRARDKAGLGPGTGRTLVVADGGV